ncbi:hypothetical protein [Pleurocapsa sp. PCC 7319]|uniref:hypothetical protein n=1 Tax=Pleurocapsa sp. PCC 7319 TaxID=118161 RepID=UPI0003823FF9
MDALDISSRNQEQKQELFREDIGEYVAQLQIHMALQARNLVPTLTNTSLGNSRQQMLRETQAVIEKFASRQSL